MAEWDELQRRRDDLVREFAATVAVSIARDDTTHPAFHGCYDWHSAVHGTYALLAASRITGDPGYRDAALAAAGAADVTSEAAALVEGRLEVEIPYGAGWVLILDAEASHHDLAMYRELAGVCRDRLFGHVERLASDGRLADAARDEEYPNAIWSAISLLRWGRQVDDARAVEAATRYAPDLLDAVRGRPVGTSESVGRGFFSPVHLAVLLAADLGREDAADLAAPVAERALLDADEMPTVHSAGLNFSRAWGTYAAWRATRNDDWRERYARFVLGHAAMPSRWRDDYDHYGHWVPQFGIFAIAESVDR